ncbi:endonuclease domain-containing protein [Mucilaginibacter ginkgonis]|uniref:DUF559 domain-containing protein n=1 Tax=Mucilaginibacter ginkgonis TaxID=2682091 RepID=A0A7T7FDX9_9SPHI|nr:DUF559 domain-containing protein [Mucilaginibacter ginkgonis]
MVDFYCNELDLVIELDGRYHGSEEKYNEDNLRDALLREHNLIIMRFDESEVRDDIDNVIRTIETYILGHQSYKHTPNPSHEGNLTYT